jgi:hypothetical protein
MIKYVPSSTKLSIDNSFLLSLYFYSTHFFVSYICVILCRSILRTRSILFLLIFLGTFPFHWFPVPQRFSCGISKMKIMLCPFRLCRQVFGPWQGCASFPQPNDPWILKEIQLYLENYNFQIHMKWAIVNSLSFANTKYPSMKVSDQPIFPFIPLCCF